MPLAAISVVSAGVIGYEILLTRLFSIVQWHNFVFMIISIALLGFGASGAFLALARDWLLARFDTVWRINAALFGLLSVASFALAQRVPFNPLELAWNPAQAAYLTPIYLLLAAPFFCAANCVGLTFCRFPERIGRIYFFDLCGAGAGAFLIIGALFALAPEDALRLILVLGFAAAALVQSSGKRRQALTLAVAGIALAAFIPASWIAPVISPYKGLSLALQAPGAEIVAERSSPLGLVSVVRSPTIPFRHAPGLSLNSRSEPPEQLGVFIDGGSMTAITRHDGDWRKLAYLDFMTEAAAYHLLTSPDVLAFGAGTGAPVLLGKLHGAKRIDAVEINPAVASLMEEDFADFSGNIHGAPGASLHISEARSFAAAGSRLYDLIQIPPLGSSSSGGGLGETYAYTVEAFGDYLARLKPGGLIAATLELKLPPRGSLKLFATAIQALEKVGAADPGRRLALVRGWKTTTLLVKNGPFSARQIEDLRGFARQRSFDLAYYPGMARAEANRFNRLQAPYFFDGAHALLGDGREAFLRNYKFDLRPATDNRPYFFDFLKWRALPEFLALRLAGGAPMVEWGVLILFVTLVQSVVLSALLIVLPLKALSRQRQRLNGGGWRIAIYFMALGLAFLFVEIAFIQKLTLFLGHPLYSIAVVLAAFLLFAGLGAGVSSKLAAVKDRAAIDLAVSGVVVTALAYLFVLTPLLDRLAPLPIPVKIAAALALIAPLAFFMGMPFPLGLARVSKKFPQLVPWAWGINGCASVISAVLATALALHFGFAAVIGTAIALYAAAALCKPR